MPPPIFRQLFALGGSQWDGWAMPTLNHVHFLLPLGDQPCGLYRTCDDSSPSAADNTHEHERHQAHSRVATQHSWLIVGHASVEQAQKSKRSQSVSKFVVATGYIAPRSGPSRLATAAHLVGSYMV